MRIESKEITIAGEKIHYVEQNNGANVTIVFVHGFYSSNVFIASLLKLENNYNVVALDLPGNGKSSCNETPMVARYQKITLEFVERLPYENVIILGHSLGAASAAYTAIHSKKVSRLVMLSAINPFMIKDDEMREHMRKLINPQSANEIAQSVKSLISNNQKTSYLKNIVAISRSFTNLMSASKGVFKPMLENELLNKKYLETDLLELYLCVKKPILMIHGANDHYISIVTARKLAKELQVNPIIIDYCGHAPIFEYPILLNTILEQLVGNTI